MILVSDAGSICMSGFEDARIWPLVTSMVIQARAAMVGAGTADSSANCVTVTGAAGATAGVGASGCCCAQVTDVDAINADNTALARTRRENATEDGKDRVFFIGKKGPQSKAARAADAH